MKNVSQETIDLALSFVRAKVGQKPDGKDFTFEDMYSPNRQAYRVKARRYFCWYLRVQKQFSFPHIASIINRDHSSIMHLVESLNEQLGLEKNYPLNEWQKINVLHLQQSWSKICDLSQAGMAAHTISDFVRVPVHQVYGVLRESGLMDREPPRPQSQYVQRLREEMADA